MKPSDLTWYKPELKTKPKEDDSTWDAIIDPFIAGTGRMAEDAAGTFFRLTRGNRDPEEYRNDPDVSSIRDLENWGREVRESHTHEYEPQTWQWYLNQAAESVPEMLGMMATSTAAGTAVAPVVGTAGGIAAGALRSAPVIGRGVTSLGKAIQAYLRGNSAGSRVARAFTPHDARTFSSAEIGAGIEAELEAQGVYNQAIAAGMSVDDAERAAADARLKNFGIISLANAPAYNYLFGAPARQVLGMARPTQQGLLGKAGKFAGYNVLPESLEEGAQEIANQSALPFGYDPQAWLDSAIVGGLMGFGMGGAGAIGNRVINGAPPSYEEQLETWRRVNSAYSQNEADKYARKKYETQHGDEIRRQSQYDATKEQYARYRDWARDKTANQMSDETFNLIVQAANKYGVPVDHALATAFAESDGNPNIEDSPVGAIGIMQLMPSTAADLGADPRNLEQNIDAGVRYLKQQYDATGDWTLAHAAYNAGLGNVQKAGGVPNFPETQNYVAKIDGYLRDVDNARYSSEDSPNAVYRGENGGAEGKYWVRNPNMNVSTEGMRPESLNALDMLGKYFFDHTGKRLILNAGTNGDHAEGEFSHANGWKFDIIDQLAGDGALFTADYGKGSFLDQFIQYGRSLGLGMNFEGEGTSNVHLDVAVDGTQWDGNGDNAGGFNPNVSTQSHADQLYNQRITEGVQRELKPKEPEKPLFDINAEDTTTPKLIEQFLTDKATTALSQNDAPTLEFINPLLNGNTFQDTPENRQAVLGRYGDELINYIQSNSQSEQPTQPQTPKTQTSQTRQSVQPKDKNQAILQEGKRFLEELRQNNDQSKAQVAFQLQDALNKGNYAEVEKILNDNGRTIQQPQPAQPTQPTQPTQSQQQQPVSKNKPPQNTLTQPKLTTEFRNSVSSAVTDFINRVTLDVNNNVALVPNDQSFFESLQRIANQHGTNLASYDDKTILEIAKGLKKIGVNIDVPQVDIAGANKQILQQLQSLIPLQTRIQQTLDKSKQQRKDAAIERGKKTSARIEGLREGFNALSEASEIRDEVETEFQWNERRNDIAWENYGEATAQQEERQQQQEAADRIAKEHRERTQKKNLRRFNRQQKPQKEKITSPPIQGRTVDEANTQKETTALKFIRATWEKSALSKTKRIAQGKALLRLLEAPSLSLEKEQIYNEKGLVRALKEGSTKAIELAQSIINDSNSGTIQEVRARHDEAQHYKESEQARIAKERKQYEEESAKRAEKIDFDEQLDAEDTLLEHRLDRGESLDELFDRDTAESSTRIEQAEIEDELDLEDEIKESQIEANIKQQEEDALFGEDAENQRNQKDPAYQQAIQAQDEYQKKQKAKSQNAGEYAQHALAKSYTDRNSKPAQVQQQEQPKAEPTPRSTTQYDLSRFAAPKSTVEETPNPVKEQAPSTTIQPEQPQPEAPKAGNVATFRKKGTNTNELKNGRKAILNAPEGTTVKAVYGGFGNPNTTRTYVTRNGKLQPLDENGRNDRRAYALTAGNMRKYFGDENTRSVELTYPEGREQPAQPETPKPKVKRSKKAEALHKKFKTDTHPLIGEEIDRLIAITKEKPSLGNAYSQREALNTLKLYEKSNVIDEMLDKHEAKLRIKREEEENYRKEYERKEAERKARGKFVSEEETDIEKIKAAFRAKVDEIVDLSKYPQFEEAIKFAFERDIEAKRGDDYTIQDVKHNLSNRILMLRDGIDKYGIEEYAESWAEAQSKQSKTQEPQKETPQPAKKEPSSQKENKEEPKPAEQKTAELNKDNNNILSDKEIQSIWLDPQSLKVDERLRATLYKKFPHLKAAIDALMEMHKLLIGTAGERNKGDSPLYAFYTLLTESNKLSDNGTLFITQRMHNAWAVNDWLKHNRTMNSTATARHINEEWQKLVKAHINKEIEPEELYRKTGRLHFPDNKGFMSAEEQAAFDAKQRKKAEAKARKEAKISSPDKTLKHSKRGSDVDTRIDNFVEDKDLTELSSNDDIESAATELLRAAGIEAGSAYVRRKVTVDNGGHVVIETPFHRDEDALKYLSEQFKGSYWEAERSWDTDTTSTIEFIFQNEGDRDTFVKAANIFYGNSINGKYSKRGKADTKIDNFVEGKDLTPQQQLLKSFGKMLGVKTIFFRNADARFHGAHSGNTTYINVNSEMPLSKVFWHESLHWLKANNPELYKDLAKTAGITTAQRQAYLGKTERTDIKAPDEINEEILADQFEDTAKRTGLFQSIAGKNRGLIQRVVQWLKDTMNKFIDHFRNPDGKLTTKQAQAFADEFGRIANQLKDPDGNKIFRYNRRTRNIELADGRKVEDFSFDEKETRENIARAEREGTLKYSVGNNNNSSESLWHKAKNAMSPFFNAPEKRKRKIITDNLRRLNGYRILYGYVDGADDVVIDNLQKLIKSRNAYDWEKLLPVVSEGIAKNLRLNATQAQSNYIADWLTTGALNNTTSPEAKAFEKAMRDNPAMGEILLETRKIFEKLANMDAWDSVKSTIAHRQNKTFWEKIKFFKDNFTEEVLDDLQPLQNIVDTAIKQAPPAVAEMIKRGVNVKQLAQIARGRGATADMMINGNADEIAKVRSELAAQYVGCYFDDFKTLKMIIESVDGDWKGLEAFALAKLSKEMYEKNSNLNPKEEPYTPYMTEANADHIINTGEAKFGEAQKDLVRFSKILAAMEYDAGLITDATFARFMKGWKEYIPTPRVWDENEDYNKIDFMKAKRGHTDDTWSPVQTIMANTHKIIQACERNKVKLELATLIRFGGFESNLSEVPTGNPDADNIIRFKENGKTKYLETPDPAIKRAIEAMHDKSEANWLTKTLRATAGFIRAVYTLLNPDFAAGNIFRDLPDAFIHNKQLGDTTSIMGMIQAWGAMFRALPSAFSEAGQAFWSGKFSEDFIEWQMNGGAQASFVSEDVDYIQRSIDTATSGKRFSGVLDTFQKLSELSENVTRLTSYKVAKANLAKAGKTGVTGKQLAALAAREASVDFSKAGRATRTLNKAVIFTNAAVQGINQWVEAFRELGKGNTKPLANKLWRAMVNGVLVAALQALAVHFGDDDDKKAYEQAPDWEKETYWLFPAIGWRIPKGMDIGIRLFANLTDEAIGAMFYGKSMNAKRIFWDTAYNALPSLTATIVTPAVEVLQNYSYFRGAPIDPKSEQHLPAHMRYDETTSGVAKGLGGSWLAKLFSDGTGWSPRKIDYLINGYLGFMGRFLTHLPNYGERALRGEAPFSFEEFPITRRFTFTPYKNPKIVKEFYEAYDEQEQLYNEYKLTKERPDDYDTALHKRIKNAYELMHKISKQEKTLLSTPDMNHDERKAKLQNLEKRRVALAERVFQGAR